MVYTGLFSLLFKYICIFPRGIKLIYLKGDKNRSVKMREFIKKLLKNLFDIIPVRKNIKAKKEGNFLFPCIFKNSVVFYRSFILRFNP